MTPEYQDDWLTVYVGECRSALRALDPESVDCCVTSPPYWGLRDYGTASWLDGDPECDHEPPGVRASGDARASTLNGGTDTIRAQELAARAYRGKCGRCGATRVDDQIGLEATPELYVATLVDVFREVRRVLKPGGTIWVNLGDTYAGGNTTGRNDGYRAEADRAKGWSTYDVERTPIERTTGLKPKDLVGIPWRVAFALQADGWYLRSDVIWSKPNPMPESVTDRPSKSHEYVFLLSKSERYFFDQEAVAEPASEPGLWPGPGRQGIAAREQLDGPSGENPRPRSEQLRAAAPKGSFNGKRGDEAFRATRETRNIRTVWTIPTIPYPGAHFAVYPPKLVERCIKAGCPEGGVVLDPFAGSGTTGAVAQRLSRRAILIELNRAYIEQQMTRNRHVPLGL